MAATLAFEFETQYGTFADALALPDDHALTAGDIEALKAERLAGWLAVVETPEPDA